MSNAYTLGKGIITFDLETAGETMPFKIESWQEDVIDGLTLRSSMSGKITHARVQDFPVKKLKWMRVRHKATGRAALGIPVKDGLVIVQFNNIKAMGILSAGWHLYPRHHFKRRRGK